MGPFVHSAFETRCHEQPGKTALVLGERRVSYGELIAQVNGIAVALHETGITHGDRVVLLLDSGVDYVAALHAVWRLGAVAVPLGPQTKAAKLETGLTIQVPAYLESGEYVQVDTRDARFVSRAKS